MPPTLSGLMTKITRTWSRPPYQGYGLPRYFWASVSMCVGRADGGDLDHPAAHLEVARGVVRVGDGDGHARVPLDVPGLHVALHAVDDHVLAVGVDPGLGHLRRTVGHRGGEIADARPAQQREQFFGEFHGDLSASRMRRSLELLGTVAEQHTCSVMAGDRGVPPARPRSEVAIAPLMRSGNRPSPPTAEGADFLTIRCVAHGVSGWFRRETCPRLDARLFSVRLRPAHAFGIP